MPKDMPVFTKPYGDIKVTSYGKPDAKLAAKLLTPIIQRLWLQQNGFNKSQIDSFLNQ